MKEETRVLIVDDSAVVRHVYREVLESNGIIVLATANDPFEAVRHIAQVIPDVMIVDVEMPRMDGITFLRKVMDQCPIPTIICSSHTAAASGKAFEAARAGAVEVLEKPSNFSQNREFAARLVDAVKTASIARVRVPKRELARNSHQMMLGQKTTPAAESSDKLATKTKQKASTSNRDVSSGFTKSESTTQGGGANRIPDIGARRGVVSKSAIIAIGASTGGTEAIRQVLANLPMNLPPIFVVQHMPVGFTASFANWLDGCCKIQVSEASEGRLVTSGQAVIARGGQHLRVRIRNGQAYSVLGDEAPVNRHRPSVDVLFDSVISQFGAKAHGILLTGMGDDGADGLLRLRQTGAKTIAESEESAVVFGMPKEAIMRGAAAMVLSLEEIAGYLGSTHFEEVS
jgi:two-component system chemotaxis response regulator CheB